MHYPRLTTSSEMGQEANPTLSLLSKGRELEKEQALFYLRLAAQAEEAGEQDFSERLNELHADEQHHLSRLTARLIELGVPLDSLHGVRTPEVTLDGWEDVARTREAAEVEWYQDALRHDLDDKTRIMLEGNLDAERHHHDTLGGKWMPA